MFDPNNPELAEEKLRRYKLDAPHRHLREGAGEGSDSMGKKLADEKDPKKVFHDQKTE
jgi:hypothetical protein